MLRCNVKSLKNNWAVARALAATLVSLEGLQEERSRKVLICQARNSSAHSLPPWGYPQSIRLFAPDRF